MSLLTAANDEAVRLIREACGPVPKPLHARFLELVDRLLRNDEILIPAKVMEACRRVQAELLIAPAVDQERPHQPSTQPPRSPFRRRA